MRFSMLPLCVVVFVSGCALLLPKKPVNSLPELPPAPEATWDLKAIAVIPAQESRHVIGRYTELLSAIEDDFAAALLTKGYAVGDRSHIATLLRERDIYDTLNAEQAQEIAGILKVDGLLIVRVNQLSRPEVVPPPEPGLFDNIVTVNKRSVTSPPRALYEVRASVSARLIRASDGSVLWVQTEEIPYQADTPERARQALNVASRRLASQFPRARVTAPTLAVTN